MDVGTLAIKIAALALISMDEIILLSKGHSEKSSMKKEGAAKLN